MGFDPPPYPYDRLDDLRSVAERHEGGCVDLSVGTPTDPPPVEVVEALASSATARGYPPSVGTPAHRAAAAGWLVRRFGVSVDPAELAVCVGTKELVVGLPHLLALRDPGRDTVLYPALSYPSYEMGATLAGLRALPVPVDEHFRLDLSAIDPADAQRALCLWVDSPANPSGALDDLEAIGAWGRQHGVVVLSDECYAEFTWAGPARSILEHGREGVLALHSLSKRSNLAGLRVGFYVGDPELVRYVSEVRKHAGLMVPGPVQEAAALAWSDDAHVEVQRERYSRRLHRLAELLGSLHLDVVQPGGGFYLWVPAPSGDGWDLAGRLAEEAGVLCSPGEFYGEAGRGYARLAVVRGDDQLDLVARRLGMA